MFSTLGAWTVAEATVADAGSVRWWRSFAFVVLTLDPATISRKPPADIRLCLNE